MLVIKNNQVQIKTKDLTKLSKPWKVIVYDDPVNLMTYVAHVFQKVFGYNQAKANELMQMVHEKGKAIVWTGEKEKAEFYVQQLHAYQLTAAMEI
jgi:ATP-dependent Clp protease adaptor protein ClpS